MVAGNETLPDTKKKLRVLEVSSKSAMDLATELELMRKKVDLKRQHGQGSLETSGKHTDLRIKKRDTNTISSSPNAGKGRSKKFEESDIYEKSRTALKEKAKLYKKIKRGEIEYNEDLVMMDGDANRVEAASTGTESSNNDSDDDNDDDEIIEITDSYGRTRLVPASKAFKYGQADIFESSDEEPSKVRRPTEVIYGDTVQYEAFSLDRGVAESVRERDKSLDEDVHYDADWEIRDRGVGFYKFSKDTSQRSKEMESLANMSVTLEQEASEQAKLDSKRDREYQERLEDIMALRKANLARGEW
ncbi:hypothetical protein AWJ20_3613 [Sugiyamaella lignohabitans]|uniref:Uncharacterized protein n=1 Tax=Sugiyamaella lignohabitans TaxID=796027 RepID=A0A170QY47_9ASCO|nr:uncharacterized protein AWJ20_3613 [Sugiyamaella lignohabitans]ANB15964.1 hypothetical protein AWJ20_3613 [Sugiyamaella lignohabitans]